jgi:glutamine amidotransferase
MENPPDTQQIRRVAITGRLIGARAVVPDEPSEFCPLFDLSIQPSQEQCSGMCQLFAMSSSAPSAVTFSFTGFSARGGHTGEHVDGWGIAFHDPGGCRVFIDEKRASDSPLAEFLRKHPIRSRTVLAHIRKATQGPVLLANCHPFVREWQGRHWTFCHNGDLKEFHPRLNGDFEPVGGTDSERAFCWMLQELRGRFRGGERPGWRDLAEAIAELAPRVARHGVFNFILGNGDALFAYCTTQLTWMARSHPFKKVKLVDQDLTINLGEANRPEDHMVLVATEPLTHGETWIAFAPGELKVLVGGAEAWSTHGLRIRQILPALHETRDVETLAVQAVRRPARDRRAVGMRSAR